MPATPFLAVCFPNMKHSYERASYFRGTTRYSMLLQGMFKQVVWCENGCTTVRSAAAKDCKFIDGVDRKTSETAHA